MTAKEWADLILEIFKTIFSWQSATLILVIIFRVQILELFRDGGKRLKNFKIAGAEFEFATVDTFLGKTNVSAVSTDFSGDSEEYSSKRYGFKISRPCGDDWVGGLTQQKRDIAETAGILPAGSEVVFRVTYTGQADGRLAPNVNVLIDPIGDESLNTYMAKSIKWILGVRQASGADSRIESFDIDHRTGGAFFSYILSFTDPQTGRPQTTLHVARVILSKGLAFVATATVLKDANSGIVQRDLNSILNSFYVVDAALNPDPAA
jgi:hypothetical protein